MDLDTARGFFRSAPFMVDLGVEPVAVGEGRITTVLALQPRHMQHMGQAHAGVMTSLADHSMGAAAQTLAAPGHWALTAELKVSCLRAGKGARLVCAAQVIKPGRTLSFTEAEVFVESDGGARALVLKASATMVLVARAA